MCKISRSDSKKRGGLWLGNNFPSFNLNQPVYIHPGVSSFRPEMPTALLVFFIVTVFRRVASCPLLVVLPWCMSYPKNGLEKKCPRKPLNNHKGWAPGI